MEEKEIWETITFIEGFEYLEISSLGRLREKESQELRKDVATINGYIMNEMKSPITGEKWVALRHSIVYFQFHPEADYSNYGGTTKGSLVVNHLDENKTNNNLNNLELITIEENIRYSKNVPVVSINVNDLTDIKYYKSASQAEREDPKNYNSNIIQCCLGNKKSCNGKYWIYKKDDLDNFINEVKTGNIVAGKGMAQALAIIGKHVKTGNLLYFPSMTKAVEHGFSRSTIKRSVKNITSNPREYKWYYLEDYLKENPDFNIDSLEPNVQGFGSNVQLHNKKNYKIVLKVSVQT